MFYIWDAIGSRKLLEPTGLCTPFLFETEDEASEYIAKTFHHNTQYVTKYYPTDTWICIERDLIESKARTLPVWYHCPWYQERENDILAFPHVDPKDKAMILYYESGLKGKRNKTTSTTPGKFLQKYFGDILSQPQIKMWAERHKETFEVVQPNKELKWADTPQQIEMVYSAMTKFYSCMGDIRSIHHSIGHPTRAYGAGDLSVAYVHQGQLVLARAVVWREKGLVGRVYGDDTLLRTLLKKDGIKSNSNQDKFDVMVGAKMLLIPLQGKLHRAMDVVDSGSSLPDIVVPKLDGNATGLSPVDGNLVIDPPDRDSLYHADNENGYSQASNYVGQSMA